MTPPLQIGAGSRPDRYTARLDRHLAKLPNDASRLAFLIDQRRLWDNARSDFLHLPTGGATIDDYNEVIFRIHDRIGACRGRLENKAIAERAAAKAGAGAASPAATGARS